MVVVRVRMGMIRIGNERGGEGADEEGNGDE